MQRLPQFVFLHGQLHIHKMVCKKTIGSIHYHTGNSNCMWKNERDFGAIFYAHVAHCSLTQTAHIPMYSIRSTCMHDHMILTFKKSDFTHAQATREYYVPPPALTAQKEKEGNETERGRERWGEGERERKGEITKS